MSLFVRAADFVMVTRPVVLVSAWGFCALGFRSAVRVGLQLGIIESARQATLFDYCAILIFSLSVAAVFVINQIADIDVDRKNGGMPLIAGGIVSVKQAWGVAGICATVSILVPIFFGARLLAAAAFITLVVGYLYSFKPLRFSGRPIADFICNAAGYGIIAFGVGWIVAGKCISSSFFVLSFLPYLLMMSGGSISSTLPDMAGDKEVGKTTTAVVLGILPAHTLALSFLLAAAFIAFYVNDSAALLCALVPVPLYILLYFRRTRAVMEATYKIGGALCVAVACASMPLLLPLAVIVFVATRLYFRMRHGVSYPSLVPVRSDA